MPSHLCFNKPPGDSDACKSLKPPAPTYTPSFLITPEWRARLRIPQVASCTPHPHPPIVTSTPTLPPRDPLQNTAVAQALEMKAAIGKWYSQEITHSFLSFLHSLDCPRDGLDTKPTDKLPLGGHKVQFGPTALQVGFIIPQFWRSKS